MKRLICAMAVVCSLAVFPPMGYASLLVTEVMSDSAHPTGGDANGDWFELTNTGVAGFNMTGYSWDDADALPGTSIFPADLVIGPGESILVVNEPAGNMAGFNGAWGLPGGGDVRAFGKDEFVGGTEGFSKLSPSGDEVNIFDAADVLVTMASFGTALQGHTFEWDTFGGPQGFSVIDENGAYKALNDGFDGAGVDVASPGIALPEVSALGDMDVNAVVDFDDIAPFNLGLTNEAEYETLYGQLPVINGDTDFNGIFDFDDIVGFVALLGGGQAVGAVPEPATCGLAIVGILLAVGAYRRS